MNIPTVAPILSVGDNLDLSLGGWAVLFFFVRIFLGCLPIIVATVRNHHRKWWIYLLAFLGTGYGWFGWPVFLVGWIYFSLLGLPFELNAVGWRCSHGAWSFGLSLWFGRLAGSIPLRSTGVLGTEFTGVLARRSSQKVIESGAGKKLRNLFPASPAQFVFV